MSAETFVSLHVLLRVLRNSTHSRGTDESELRTEQKVEEDNSCHSSETVHLQLAERKIPTR